MGKLDDVQGHHKVAAFLLSLDPAARATVMGKMKPDAVELVASAMLELDPRLTEAGVVEELKDALARAAHGAPVVRPCGEDDLASLLTTSLGRQQGESVVQEILDRRRKSQPFRALERFDPFEVGTVLREESNAVTALVLSNLDPTRAANVLKVFDDEQAVEVVRRMATLEPPSPTVVQSIAAELHGKLANQPKKSGTSDPSARLKYVADVLNKSKPEMEKGVIESIADESVDMAQELREYMFTWEDIATIDTRTMQKILGMVDTKTLSMALKGASEEVEDNVLGNLSSRVKDMVSDERELLGPVPMSEVRAARDEIMKSIRAMIEAGEFRPSKGGEELVA